jgi:bifunctional ADP-heptose synthase (sugar kinase/adenylyltransferase)
MNRVLERKEAQELIDKLKKEGKKIVFTNGCFDILHRGHITYLQEAAQLGVHSRPRQHRVWPGLY